MATGMHESHTSRAIVERNPVIPTLESISNNAAGPPLAAAPVPSQRGAGGFAFTFAAARGLGGPSSTSGEPGTVADSASALATHSNGASSVLRSQSKKTFATGSVTGNGIGPVSLLLAANQLSGIASPTGLLPSQTTFTTVENIGGSVGGLGTSSQMGGSGTVTPTSEGSSSNNVDPRNGGSAPFFTSAASAATERAVPVAVSSSAGAGVQQNNFQTKLSADLTPVAGNVPPFSLPLTSGQPPSATGLTNTTGDIHAELQQSSPPAATAPAAPIMAARASVAAGQPLPSPGLPNIAPDIHAELILPANPATASVMLAPMIGANDSLAAAPEAALLPVSDSSPLEPASFSNLATTEPAFHPSLPAPAGAGNQVLGAVNPQNLPAAMVKLPDTTAFQAVAENLIANVHGGSQGAASIPTAPSPTGSDSNHEFPVASQTPFAIFFSGPGSGAESAVSALPKMLLPTNSALRNAYSAPADAASGNAQSGGLHGGVPQSVTSTSTKGTSSGTLLGVPSPSAQSGLPSHKNDVNGGNAVIDSSQSPAAPPPAPAGLAAVIPLPSGPAPPADSLPKPQTTQGAGGGSRTSQTPATPQAPAVALPGPVQMAQMVNRMGQSEMRIGMNTSAFGSVEVRTVVHTGDVGLIIGSEKGDLRGLLANEMPALTNVLQQQNLKLNSVNFMQGFAFSNSGSGGGDSQQRPFVPTTTSASFGSSEIPRDDSGEVQPAEFSGAGSSLSILA